MNEKQRLQLELAFFQGLVAGLARRGHTDERLVATLTEQRDARREFLAGIEDRSAQTEPPDAVAAGTRET